MTPIECPACSSHRILAGPFHAPEKWRCMDCGATGKENQR